MLNKRKECILDHKTMELKEVYKCILDQKPMEFKELES